uniref:tRNA/rRNA methyltransferase SpoU type domain-containing protein n=1 Tax=Opuntia streptacantha TaxID=393608 RepID=A0A7C8ZPQ8_OPUST
MHCKRWFPHLHRILVLEGIQDPGNLGTLLRSALAFKWDGVFLLPGCCDPFNEKALRASRGAPFQLPIVSGNWTQLEALRDEAKLKLLAGHPESSKKTLPVSKLSQDLANSLADTPLCLVLGTEGGGLSQKAKELSQLVSIPMSENFESLNVAVAGGIFMFVLMSERT